MKTPSGIILIILLLGFNADACELESSDPDCVMGAESSWNPSDADTSARLNRFYQLDELINTQYEKGNYDVAKELISEYLELAVVYSDNWNYGNAIHDANRVLGLISYKQGNIDQAAEYLIKSSASTGSPQLDTFGPQMDLANLLLKQGRVKEVKLYLSAIKRFWEMDRGVVELWLQQIADGERPNLDRFSAQKMTR